MKSIEKTIECLACKEPAKIKDYRNHNGIVDGYPAYIKHAGFDDRNFWKAVRRKESEVIL